MALGQEVSNLCHEEREQKEATLKTKIVLSLQINLDLFIFHFAIHSCFHKQIAYVKDFLIMDGL